MFPARPKNLYIVYGWRVEDDVRNSMMMDKGADAAELGISLTIAESGKNAFVGKHWATLDIREGKEFTGVQIPKLEDQQAIEEASRTLKLPVTGPPILYVVAG